MTKAHKIKLYPTKAQEVLFKKSCGVARFSYNWGINKWNELYAMGENPTAYTLIKIQNCIKKTDFPFFTEVGKSAPQYALHNLEKAFKRMRNIGAGYPKYKKKGASKDSFVSVENSQAFKMDNLKIRLPRIGYVKCAENLRFEGKVNNVVVKRVANIWFAIINIETYDNDIPAVNENQVSVGVDLGIKSMIVLSDGTIFENPRSLKNNLKQLKRRQRRFSKKKTGSKNQHKQQMKLARLHYRISLLRNSAIHAATTFIVKKYDKIVIEDLKVKDMGSNHKLAQAIRDVSWGEIASQLSYKAQWSGKTLIKADRFFASSKICSKCGHKKKKLHLGERIFNCEQCGNSIDRDLNAAINLANYSPTQKSGESYASGFGSS